MLRHIRKTALKTVSTSIVVVAGVELATKLPSEGRSSELYHHFTDKVVTPLMRSLLNPENAHHVALYFLQRGFAPTHRPNILESSSNINLSVLTKDRLLFPNCIGLAAGFDKDGVAIENLMALGFGFVEIGSITPKPQPGNSKPRMFRLIEDQGIINRFGFNSIGIDAVEENLKAFRHRQQTEEEGQKNLPGKRSNSLASRDVFDSFSKITVSIMKSVLRFFFPPFPKQPKSLLGINLGKNKTSTKETEDYEIGIERLGQYADYLVINISSPNTPGLRNLQQSEPIRRLLKAAMRKRNELPFNENHSKPPLFVKIAPDLSDSELEDISNAVIECDIDGILVSNTSNQRPESLESRNSDEIGGLSGSPIRHLSTECIRKMYKLTGGNVFIVGIGGVGSGHDVYEKMKAGASVVQIYSQMTYQGPGLVSRIRKELSEIMRQNGQHDVTDVIGLDHDEIFWEKKLKRAMEV
mmetsp:Transcript_22500/g.27582  ORF Transcript_22500/g.27582 Transcript_22500/m.27582 type:complete len:468 (-) Transcript_22500:311-1714(-)